MFSLYVMPTLPIICSAYTLRSAKLTQCSILDDGGWPQGWEHITQYTLDESLWKDFMDLLSGDPKVRDDIEDMFMKESCPLMPQSRSPVCYSPLIFVQYGGCNED